MPKHLLTVCLLFCALLHALEAAPPVELARDGKALLPVIVGEKAGKQTRAAAEDLASCLSKISGGKFEVQVGDGSRGIVVGLPGDFAKLPFAVTFKADAFSREDYALRSADAGLWLLGSTELAAQHAVWDLLHRLGYRQFFPGPVWEVVPSSPDLAISVDVRESPDYVARRIWYNWGLWGYNRRPYQQWCARNRMARGLLVRSGHAYGSIIRANQKAFKEHPEYLSLINGKRKTGGGTKFCISNPGLRRLVVDHAVRYFKGHPNVDSISMEPSDGGHWCRCKPCNEMGTPSDRALTLANEVAEAVNGLGLGDKYVGMYAYHMHCAPPSIRVHPKVVVSVTTAFLTGGHSFNGVVRGWQKQGATIGVYDYFSVVAWDWNRPRASRSARPAPLAAAIKQRHEMGARFYDAESGDAWGPYGLGYYVAGRTMWDVAEAERVDEIVSDFLTKAFGPARKPMQSFYELITVDRTRRSSADLIGRMYRHLAEARKLAAHDEAVRRRIDDLILYTRYAELYYRFASATGKAKAGAKNDLLRYIYRIRETMMIHAYGLWARLASQRAANDKKNPLRDSTPVTEAELLEFLRKGIESNQPVDMDFEPVKYSTELVPAADRLAIPEGARGNYAPVPQSRQRFYIWVDKAPAELALKVKTKKVWRKREPQIVLHQATREGAKQVMAVDGWGPDNKWHEVTLKTPHKGLHIVELIDGGDYSHVQWPDDLPVTLASALDSPRANNYFRGSWTMYFYVPKGTKIVAGWAERVATWAPRISGVLKDSSGHVHVNFAKRDDGWFSVNVPEGQDGTFWRFERSQGLRRMVTVPPYMAVEPRLLLLPREVVENDTLPVK